jgi:hypothetical protein
MRTAEFTDDCLGSCPMFYTIQRQPTVPVRLSDWVFRVVVLIPSKWVLIIFFHVYDQTYPRNHSGLTLHLILKKSWTRVRNLTDIPSAPVAAPLSCPRTLSDSQPGVQYGIVPLRTCSPRVRLRLVASLARCDPVRSHRGTTVSTCTVELEPALYKFFMI